MRVLVGDTFPHQITWTGVARIEYFEQTYIGVVLQTAIAQAVVVLDADGDLEIAFLDGRCHRQSTVSSGVSFPVIRVGIRYEADVHSNKLEVS